MIAAFTSTGVVAVWEIGIPAATSASVASSIGSMPPNMRDWGNAFVLKNCVVLAGQVVIFAVLHTIT